MYVSINYLFIYFFFFVEDDEDLNDFDTREGEDAHQKANN